MRKAGVPVTSRTRLRDRPLAAVRVRRAPGDPSRGWLVATGLSFPVALGRAGIRADKREGDGATPRGVFHPRRLWWRADRHPRPPTLLPQRATFEVLDRRYVYLVGKDGVARQREIAVRHEVGDLFVVGKGLDVNDRIVLDGVRRVRDGDKVESVFRKPEEAYGRPKAGREK